MSCRHVTTCRQHFHLRTVSQSVKGTVFFRCILHGFAEPRAPSFSGTLIQDNLRARYVQDICSFEYSVRLVELGGFFRDQRWRHIHDVIRSQGITFHELGHQGLEASLAILKAEGITRREALREIGLRRQRGALASLKALGFTGEGAASFELSRRGGEARSAIYRESGNCIYPGCTYAIHSGEFCVKHHQPIK